MQVAPNGLTLPGLTHHRVAVNGTHLHYVSAGHAGPPILLVHGFPETWWTFHKLIPLLAEKHRVFAVDLRGFGDSDNDAESFGSHESAADLHALVRELGVGPVHLAAQDIGGGAAFRLATMHPADVASFTAIEMGLAGFGLEQLADVTRGGAWHIGVLAANGIPELLLEGREAKYLGEVAFPSMCATPDAFSVSDVAEFARSYARRGGWRGATGLYRAMLEEGDELRALAETNPMQLPVLAVGAGGGGFTAATMARALGNTATMRAVTFEGVGHYVAMEAPERLAKELARHVESTRA